MLPPRPPQPPPPAGYDLKKMTMQQLVDKYGLDKDTTEFVGCAGGTQSTT
jgi:hypothetical protein